MERGSRREAAYRNTLKRTPSRAPSRTLPPRSAGTCSPSPTTRPTRPQRPRRIHARIGHRLVTGVIGEIGDPPPPGSERRVHLEGQAGARGWGAEGAHLIGRDHVPEHPAALPRGPAHRQEVAEVARPD